MLIDFIFIYILKNSQCALENYALRIFLFVFLAV